MNIDQFNALQEEYGENVVWHDSNRGDGEYCFSLGDELVGNTDEEVIDFQLKMWKMWSDGTLPEGISWYIAYGDDTANCVSVKELSDFDKIPGLEEFVLAWLGENCYTSDEEIEDDE